jgi:hypothetical protein
VIAEALLHKTLPRNSWTHAAHFAAALWFLCRYSVDDSLLVLRDAIRTFNEATGVANTLTSGYHETITQASLRAASHFRNERITLPIHLICNELLASRFGRSDWLLHHWTKERLFSPDARECWVDPDVSKLPF